MRASITNPSKPKYAHSLKPLQAYHVDQISNHRISNHLMQPCNLQAVSLRETGCLELVWIQKEQKCTFLWWSMRERQFNFKKVQSIGSGEDRHKWRVMIFWDLLGERPGSWKVYDLRKLLLICTSWKMGTPIGRGLMRMLPSSFGRWENYQKVW